MGQAQSDVADDSNTSLNNNNINDNNNNNNIPQPSIDSLIAEAVAFGSDGNESLDVQAQKALDCPCIADLRSGSCGTQFSEAFLCFMKSTAEEKGSDCVHPFVALQSCIKAHPDAFSKDILDGNEDAKKEVEPTKEYKIRQPVWLNSRDPKPKL